MKTDLLKKALSFLLVLTMFIALIPANSVIIEKVGTKAEAAMTISQLQAKFPQANIGMEEIPILIQVHLVNAIIKHRHIKIIPVVCANAIHFMEQYNVWGLHIKFCMTHTVRIAELGLKKQVHHTLIL